MRKETTMRKTAEICVLCLLLASTVAWSGGAGVGDAAPDFTLQDLDGNEVTLSKIDGVRVLEWVNPDCPFVKRHYQAGTMKGLAATYSTRGVTWLTINSTHSMDRETNREFVKAYGLTQTILMDPSHPNRVRKKAAQMIGDIGEVEAIEPLRNARFGNGVVQKEVDAAISKIHARYYTRECPFCAEIIKKRAKVCKHCHAEIGGK